MSDCFDVYLPIYELSPEYDHIIKNYIQTIPKFSNNLLAYIIDNPGTRCICCGDKNVGINATNIIIVWICYGCYKPLADKLVYVTKGDIIRNTMIEYGYDRLNDYICELVRNRLIDLK